MTLSMKHAVLIMLVIFFAFLLYVIFIQDCFFRVHFLLVGDVVDLWLCVPAHCHDYHYLVDIHKLELGKIVLPSCVLPLCSSFVRTS